MKNGKDSHQPVFTDGKVCTGLARFFVWLNILMQLLFPVACTFTPAIVHAQATTVVSTQDAERATRVYTLSRGESVHGIVCVQLGIDDNIQRYECVLREIE